MNTNSKADHSSSKLSASGLLSSGKDLLSFLRDLLILIIVLLLLFNPKKINDLLVNAGFEEGSVVGFKWKASLAKSNLDLNEATTTISKLRSQLDSMSIALSEAQVLIKDPSFNVKLSKLEEGNNQLKIASIKTQASVRSTISSNASLIKNAQMAVNKNNDWGVVFSADATLEKAKYEVTVAAPKFGIPNALIFYRQGYYRSVSVTDDRDQAEEILIKAKSRRADAYIVPMNTWCPNSNKKTGYQECELR